MPSGRTERFSTQLDTGKRLSRKIVDRRRSSQVAVLIRPKPRSFLSEFWSALRFDDRRGGIYVPQSGEQSCPLPIGLAADSIGEKFSPSAASWISLSANPELPAFAGGCLVRGSNPQQPDS
jgi:hypothetical protein